MLVKSGSVRDETERERIIKLKELLIILESTDNDFERATKFRRVYSSYKLFRQAYYVTRKFNSDRTQRVTQINSLYEEYKEQLDVIRDLYKNYEENGFFELAKEEEKFLLKQAGDLDARYVINAYINDSCSYDMDLFYERYKINRVVFEAAVKRIKSHDLDLYMKYLEAFKGNKTKRLVMPIYNINQIIEGINTGKTLDGNKFDKLEFYKLAPFKNKDIDKEIRFISEDFPKLLVFKGLKQKYIYSNGTRNSCTYADNLYLFTKCFSESQAELLKDWMDKNNIRNLTPIFRASIVNCYPEKIDEKVFFTKSDADEIFDTIEENGYPKIREVFNILKNEKQESKKKVYTLIENK